MSQIEETHFLRTKVSFSRLKTALMTHFLWRQIELISKLERKLGADTIHHLVKGKIMSTG